MKIFMNNITIFQFSEVHQPNGSREEYRWGLRWLNPTIQNIHFHGCFGRICVSIENTHTPVLVFSYNDGNASKHVPKKPQKRFVHLFF